LDDSMQDNRRQPGSLRPDVKTLRSYGLLMGSIIIGLFGLLLPWLFARGHHWWPWIAGGLFISMALVAPRTLGPVHALWMRLGHVMGAINTRLVLLALFVFVVTPTGWVLRLLGRDPMRKKRGTEPSYRIASRARRPQDMERPF
jgi:hypothetical protein